MVSNIRVFSPTKVNECRFGYTTLFNNLGQELGGQRDVVKELGLPFSSPNPESYGVPPCCWRSTASVPSATTSTVRSSSTTKFTRRWIFSPGSTASTRSGSEASIAGMSTISTAIRIRAAISSSMVSTPLTRIRWRATTPRRISYWAILFARISRSRSPRVISRRTAWRSTWTIPIE